MPSGDSDNGGCMGSCFRCLGKVPCGALCIFLTFVAGLCICGASLYVGLLRTREVIEQPDLWPWFMFVCIGVVPGLILLAAGFLIIATVSSDSAAERLMSSRKYRCLRAANCVVIILAVLLQFVWVVVTLTISAALLFVLLFDRMVKNGANCVNLAHYGLLREHGYNPRYCNNGDDKKLTKFHSDVEEAELMIFYSVSLISSVIVVLSLTLMVINATQNFSRLYYKQSKRGSKPAHVMDAYYDGQTGRPCETTM